MTKKFITAFFVTVITVFTVTVYAANYELLNVSYDPTRELYEQFNKSFAKHYKAKTGHNVRIKQSHGGSSKQARAVFEGLQADVVTLALAFDIDSIVEKGKLLSADWQKKLPNNSTPYSSTVVFLVRKGNPKKIKSWDDLIKPGVEVIAAHPKTSGVARWSYLAGWGYILQKELGDLKKLNDPAFAAEVEAAQKKAQAFTAELYKHVPVLDSGARGSTQTFVQREIGDVLLNWENEAFLAIREYGKDKYEIVVPPISILAEPPVAVVDKVVDKRGTRKIAEAYLKYLYSDEGQEIAARNFYRPRNEEILKKYSNNFADVKLFSIDDVFGGWKAAQTKHFSDGGVFDQINVRK
ncbi:MAG: sulfate ABC transporter substrate-binding protein [Planctomycetaceae bacterium]|jgi:sulfate transport system substrate-binding protein|nr:sulfate ABC transporter substrate-binding protein [Planctomycetaceae bacterium]